MPPYFIPVPLHHVAALQGAEMQVIDTDAPAAPNESGHGDWIIQFRWGQAVLLCSVIAMTIQTEVNQAGALEGTPVVGPRPLLQMALGARQHAQVEALQAEVEALQAEAAQAAAEGEAAAATEPDDSESDGTSDTL